MANLGLVIKTVKTFKFLFNSRFLSLHKHTLNYYWFELRLRLKTHKLDGSEIINWFILVSYGTKFFPSVFIHVLEF